MQRIGGVFRACTAVLQIGAALLWLMPQPVVAAPALLMPQVLTGSLLPDLSGGETGLPLPGDAYLFMAQTGGCSFNCPQQPPAGGGTSGSSGGGSGGYSGPQGITPTSTQKIAAMFTEASDFCHWLEPRYRIDCLYAKLRKIAQNLPRTGDYAPVRAAVVKAADRLEDVVDSFEDRAGPKVSPRLRSKPDAERLRPLSPIRPEMQDVANRAATEIVAELTTVLLRSGTQSERQQLAFQEIATAVSSTKILLRSA